MHHAPTDEAATQAISASAQTPQPTADHEELVAEARALAPLLAEHAAQTDREGRLAPASEQALRDGDFFKLLVPRRYGGLEVSISTAVDVLAELAHGCGSSAWVAGVLNTAAFYTALLPDAVRDEVWGDDGDASLCVVANVVPGAARWHPDGLVLNGRWAPASGVEQANWVCVGVQVVDEDGAVRHPAVAMVPRREVSVQASWDVAGMRGTASNTIVAEDVVVPHAHLVPLPAVLSGAYVDAHPDEPVYASTASSVSVLCLTAPVLGLAEAALAHGLARLGTGKALSHSTYAHAVDAPSIQTTMAQATSLVDTARLHLRRAAQDVDRAAARGAYLDVPGRARVRMDCVTVATRSREAVGLALDAAGASSFASANPLQRIWRDLETASRHASLNPGLVHEIYGRALLGIEEQVSRMI
jgi:3-hydroxy-9,10-secoandrosta-1,3,5(10)-triene-9,17-dione monooxygenase